MGEDNKWDEQKKKKCHRGTLDTTQETTPVDEDKQNGNYVSPGVVSYVKYDRPLRSLPVRCSPVQETAERQRSWELSCISDEYGPRI